MDTERNGHSARAGRHAGAPRKGLGRLLFETEIFFRSYTATTFFAGFSVLTIYHLIASSEPWYQYVAIISAFLGGSLLSRTRRLKFFQLEVRTETVTDEVLLLRAKGELWSAGFERGYQSAVAASAPVSPAFEEATVDVATPGP